VAIQPDSLLASLPARYSKFITVLIGLFITYVAIYGWVWHLEPALIMIGTALGVYGVPNGPPPAIPVPVPVSVSESETVIEDVPLPEPAPAPVQPAPVQPAPAPVPAQPPPGFNPPAPPHA
jgi:hypothetical protein